LFLTLVIATSQAQDFSKLLPDEPPKTAKENTKNLFAGIAIQAAGIGLTAASVFFIIEANEEDMEIGLSGFGMHKFSLDGFLELWQKVAAPGKQHSDEDHPFNPSRFSPP